MSRTFSIYVVLDEKLNYDFIKKIVEKGNELGFLFIDYLTMSAPDATTFLSVEQAIAQVIKTTKSMSSEPEVRALIFKASDTYCTLYFNNEVPMKILVSTDCYRWYKDCSTDIVDVVRYVRLVFDLLSDCNVISIKTYDSYYDDEELLRFL